MASKQARQIISWIKKNGSAKNREGMSRFGINTENAHGISLYVLRPKAKEIGQNHELAMELWKTGVHEARLLACFIGDPEKLTGKQMESMAKDFDSWDICDQCCSSLFDPNPLAWKKAVEWGEREEEFVKRAGFVLMAALSVHDKGAADSKFREFFPIIKRESGDERNFVKKAVNWALRQIGKRNKALNKDAVRAAKEIRKKGSKAARWIASDALRELESEKVKARLSR